MTYRVGEVTGAPTTSLEKILPHRRSVTWFKDSISRADMGADLRHSIGSIGTVGNVEYAEQIAALVGGQKPPGLVSTDETVEDPTAFAMESHLDGSWLRDGLGMRRGGSEGDGGWRSAIVT